nr:hypothetical protein [Tanacetum cinerariifolium]
MKPNAPDSVEVVWCGGGGGVGCGGNGVVRVALAVGGVGGGGDDSGGCYNYGLGGFVVRVVMLLLWGLSWCYRWWRLRSEDEGESDDSILGPMRFVSKADDYQVYRELLHEVMTIQKMRASPAYKTYLALATKSTTPKKARNLRNLLLLRRRKFLDTPGVSMSKKKALVTTDRNKGIDLLSEAALFEEVQVKKVLKRSRRETTIHQAGASSDGAGFQPEVPDEPKGKSVDTHEGTGLKLGVLDVSKADSSKSEYESWGDNGDEDVEYQQNDEEYVLENEESEDAFVHTPEDYVPTDETNDVDEEECDRIDKELYGDVNVRLTNVEQDDEGEGDMANAAHVQYIGSSLDDALYKMIKKHSANIIKEHSILAEIIERLKQQYAPQKSIKDIYKIKMEHARKQQVPKETITSSDTTALKEFDQKTTLSNILTKSKSFNKSPKHISLYHALIKSILEDEDVIDKGVADELKKKKPEDVDKDEGPTVGSNRGLKRQRTSKGAETSKKTFTSNDSSKRKSPTTSSKYEDFGKTNEQPIDEVVPKNDWYKKSRSDTYPDPK